MHWTAARLSPDYLKHAQNTYSSLQMGQLLQYKYCFVMKCLICHVNTGIHKHAGEIDRCRASDICPHDHIANPQLLSLPLPKITREYCTILCSPRNDQNSKLAIQLWLNTCHILTVIKSKNVKLWTTWTTNVNHLHLWFSPSLFLCQNAYYPLEIYILAPWRRKCNHFVCYSISSIVPCNRNSINKCGMIERLKKKAFKIFYFSV